MGQRWYLAILAAIEVALVVLAFTRSELTGPHATLIGVVAVLMVLVPHMSRVTELDAFGLRARMRTLEGDVASTNEQVQQANQAIDLTNQRLDALFALSISEWQYQNLRKLVSGCFGPYVRSMGLENDLRHLRNHGYIEIASVRDIPNEGEELCDHVQVTSTGESFVRFRESLDISARDLVVQDGRLRPAE